jgi:hypothetical protein
VVRVLRLDASSTGQSRMLKGWDRVRCPKEVGGVNKGGVPCLKHRNFVESFRETKN